MSKQLSIDDIKQWCDVHRGKLSPDEVFCAVLQALGLKASELRSANRKAHLCEARQGFVWFCRNLAPHFKRPGDVRRAYTFISLSNKLRRDHTTILVQESRAIKLLDAGDDRMITVILKIYEQLNQRVYEEV